MEAAHVSIVHRHETRRCILLIKKWKVQSPFRQHDQNPHSAELIVYPAFFSSSQPSAKICVPLPHSRCETQSPGDLDSLGRECSFESTGSNSASLGHTRKRLEFRLRGYSKMHFVAYFDLLYSALRTSLVGYA